jgi:hypothetical protein
MEMEILGEISSERSAPAIDHWSTDVHCVVSEDITPLSLFLLNKDPINTTVYVD